MEWNSDHGSKSKRKPSRDFPVYSQIPRGKMSNIESLNPSSVHVSLLQTTASTVPPMRDPYHINILHSRDGNGNGNGDGDSDDVDRLTQRTMSMLSTMDTSMVLNGPGEDDRHGADENANTFSTSLPKNERPTQPPKEREYYERMWAQNFERSEAQVSNVRDYIPMGAAGRLNRIKGFSLARDTLSHKLYAVFRLEIECIVNEKQWTIYRRFHDFKQLAQRLKGESIRLPSLPTKTFMRSLDTTFLRKRQLELDRWLREVLMLVSLENCKVDTENASDCCRDRNAHACCRIIRQFLTQSANEPPNFEHCNNENKSVSYGNGHGNGNARPPTQSTSDPPPPVPPPVPPGAAITAVAARSPSFAGSSGPGRTGSMPEPTSISPRPLSQLPSPIQIRSCIAPRSMPFDVKSLSTSTSSQVVIENVDEEDDEELRATSCTTTTTTSSSSSTMNVGGSNGNGNGSGGNSSKVSLKDFDVIRMIGKGSFGKVLLVRKKHASQLFAVKILSKPMIVKKQQVEHTQTERRVLASICHPFVVCLHYAFQTKHKLYFVLDYCPGGDLFFHLSRCGCFPEAMAKLYAAEIVLALLHLHDQGIIYRDLKPENIMLDVDGHVKLADFGLAKEGVGQTDTTYTMCGTPEYLPPEILNRKGHGSAVDWWNLGMVLYEMLTGRPPWYTQDREQLFVRLREAELEFPTGLSAEAMDLIRGLLNRDPTKRLGATDPRELTYHPFFADIDWAMLYNRQVQPLYRPCQYTDPIDAANFEEEYTKLPPTALAGDGLSVVSLSASPNGPRLSSLNGTRASVTNSFGASGGRHSALRNLSYTFAGFTYEGSQGL